MRIDKWVLPPPLARIGLWGLGKLVVLQCCFFTLGRARYQQGYPVQFLQLLHKKKEIILNMQILAASLFP